MKFISLRQIIDGSYDRTRIPKNDLSIYALLLSLKNVGEGNFIGARNFVKKELAQKWLEDFDNFWAGKDEERQILVSELESSENIRNKHHEDGESLED